VALLVGELKSVLSLDTSQFNKGLSTSEAKFKGSASKLDATSREVAKKAGAGIGSIGVVADKASGGIDKVKLAADRASLAQDKYTAAVKKYGAGSLQARTASLSMRTAQDNLARSNRKAAEATDDAEESMGGFAHGAGVAGVAAVGIAGALVAAGMRIGDYAAKLDLLKKKTATVFGDQLGDVQQWADKSAHAMGLTKGEAAGLAAGLGDLLVPMGFTRKAAADMATQTVGLSGALAEWSGGTKSAAEVTDILSAAFMGERDGLNALGISITQAEVDAELLANGQQNLTGKQLQQAEATATQKLIMEKSTDAQKAFANGAGSLARQTAESRAKLKEMGETLATKAAPVLLKVATFTNDKVIPALFKAGDVAKKLGDAFMGLPSPVKVGTLTLLGFVAAAAGIAATVGKVKDGIAGLKTAFTGLSTGGRYLTLSLGAVGVALAAAAAIYSIYAKRQQEAKQRVEDLRSTLDEQTGAITGNTRAYVSNQLAQNGLSEKAKSFGLSLSEVTDAALGNQAAMDAVGSALDAVITQSESLASGLSGVGGLTEGQSQKFRDQADAARALKENLLGMNTGLTEAQKQQKLAAEGAQANTTATGAQATAAGQATTALQQKAAADQKAAEAAAAHEKAVNDEIAAMLKMPGLVLSMRDAQRGWQESIDSATESLKENGKTLDITTPKGRANQDSLDAMANSANNVTKSMIENGQSNLSVVRTYEANREGLIKTAQQFGMNRKQAEAYAAKVLAIPKRSETTLKADITDLKSKIATAQTKLKDPNLTKTRKAKLTAEIKELQARVKTAQANINGLKGKSVTVDVKFSSLGYTLALGQATKKQKFAAGGPVYGGERGKDSVPALLMPDEHVWTTQETAAVGGHGAMKRIRQAALAGELRGFAKGGSPRSTLNNLLGRVINDNVLKLKVDFGSFGGAAGLGGGLGPQSFRGVKLNGRTIQMLLAAERLLGAAFHITQGSFSTRVKASGSTHAGGGAMDTNGPRGWGAAVAALRSVGFAAWHRTPSQGPWNHHIHSIAIGDPSASPAAKRQVAAYRRGGDGLGHGMAAGGRVGSYANGAWRILADQLALVHKGEMVVPKIAASPLRGILTSKLHQMHQAHVAHQQHQAHMAHLNHVRLHPDDMQHLGRIVADELRSNPPRVHLDGRAVDEGMTRRALAWGGS